MLSSVLMHLKWREGWKGFSAHKRKAFLALVLV